MITLFIYFYRNSLINILKITLNLNKVSFSKTFPIHLSVVSCGAGLFERAEV